MDDYDRGMEDDRTKQSIVENLENKKQHDGGKKVKKYIGIED